MNSELLFGSFMIYQQYSTAEKNGPGFWLGERSKGLKSRFSTELFVYFLPMFRLAHGWPAA